MIKRAEVGTAVPDLCLEHRLNYATFYKLRAKFGGIAAALMVRLTELEEVNRRLKRLFVGAQISPNIVAEALAKKTLRSSRRREVARWAVEEKGLSSKPVPLAGARKHNRTWSMGRMHDQLLDGRSYRLLNIIDDFKREALCI